MTHDQSKAEEQDLARLQSECRRLQAQLDAQSLELNLLKARFSRYETALRGSHITVYTQDRHLRYTSISNTMLGRSVEEVLGRTDEEILPLELHAVVIGAKREALSSGQAQRVEVAVEGRRGPRWYDLHIEPLRNDAGEVMGLTCAAVDVTERKEGEAHLRLLLRELTHRSKNLLAIIQAMARQTARHAGSIDAFLRQFGARLQALAASHDLLVRESWHGAALDELVRSQLGVHVAETEEQVAIGGPAVALKPEAAQNLGLALHELAANAARFGALSVPDGRLSVTWDRNDGVEGGLALEWREQNGPRVKPRRKRGFGSMVIEGNLARALDAEVDLNFDPEGLRCHIVIPANQILATR
jgi:PAS domain S-box-containing protein